MKIIFQVTRHLLDLMSAGTFFSVLEVYFLHFKFWSKRAFGLEQFLKKIENKMSLTLVQAVDFRWRKRERLRESE